MPVLEVRCLSTDGHQTPVISTLLTLEAKEIAARMFTRWCQENYFKYMRRIPSSAEVRKSEITRLTGCSGWGSSEW